MGLFDVFNPSKGVAPGAKLGPKGMAYARNNGIATKNGQATGGRAASPAVKPLGARPTGRGISARANDAAFNVAKLNYEPQKAMLDGEDARTQALYGIGQIGYGIEQEGNRVNTGAAQRKPGYITGMYNNSLSGNDQQKLQQAIANQANRRQYGLIDADRKDVGADWDRMKEALVRQQMGNQDTEKFARITAAEQVAGRGMMGAGARAGVIQGRNVLGRQTAQNTADRAKGEQDYNAANRGLDERYSKTRDQEGLGDSQMAMIGLDRDRLGIQNREDMAGANDDIQKAILNERYNAVMNQQSGVNVMYDLQKNRNQRWQLNNDLWDDTMTNLPYYTKQEQDKVAERQAQWDRAQTREQAAQKRANADARFMNLGMAANNFGRSFAKPGMFGSNFMGRGWDLARAGWNAFS